MSEQLKAAAGALFTVNGERLELFEKGWYVVLIVKPNRRLARSLSVTREILVLCTNFDEQQPRVIETARRVIAAEKGRLESNLVIVGHQDPKGNVKLRDWGREASMTLIPVCLRDSDLPLGSAFEALLSHELFSHDPFDVTGPVADDARFYGRRTEALELARHLQNSQIRSCLGIRKIGKTSVLNRVLAELQKNYDCYCVMTDCSVDALWRLRSNELISGITQAVNVATTSATNYAFTVPVPPAQVPPLHDAVMNFVGRVSTLNKPLVLFFDETDYITPGSPTAPHWKDEFNGFWRGMRAAYQEVCRNEGRLSIIVSGVSSKWFSAESIAGVENAALSFIPEEYLSPFGRNATVGMVKKLGAAAGLRFDETAADLVGEVCSDMPFWVRKACSHVHRAVPIEGRPMVLTRQVVEPLLRQFIESDGAATAKVALAHLFRVYPELESEARRYLSEKDEVKRNPEARTLEKYGILALSNGHLRLAPMVEAGMRAYLSGQAISLPSRAESPPPGQMALSLDDWAENLAIVGERRNRLERKLRELLLSATRAEVLLNPSPGATVSSRLLQGVATERRGRLQHLDPDGLVAALFWKELEILIRKEWSFFGRVFGDTNELGRHSAVLNERPDAHAKAFDAADFALYRRSLEWFEGKTRGL